MWNAFNLTQFNLADSDSDEIEADQTAEPWNIRDLTPQWDLADGTRVESWATHADQCAEAFINTFERANPEAEEFDRQTILSAAAHIWDSTRGDPAWTRFDVDAWVAELALLEDGDSLFCNASMTMLGLFEFLANGEVIPASEAHDVVETLAVYASAAWRHSRPWLRYIA